MRIALPQRPVIENIIPGKCLILKQQFNAIAYRNRIIEYPEWIQIDIKTDIIHFLSDILGKARTQCHDTIFERYVEI